MPHASDCATNDGPSFIPGPCSCGLDVGPFDPVEAFVPIVLVGAWRGHLAIRERNAETFIEAKQSKIRGGRGVRLRIDLINPHSWSIFEGGADHLNLDHAQFPIVAEREANPLLTSLKRKLSIAASLKWIRGFIGHVARLPRLS